MTAPRGGIVVMGVSGSGKSTVAAALAARLGARYVDADDLHPPENVAKMAAGVPLTDEDRMPWLRAVARALAAEPAPVVIACSALRRAYRDVLRGAPESDDDVFFVQLDVAPDLLARRVGARPGHFMPASLLASQLATLESLTPDESGVVVDGAAPLDAVVAAAADAWRARRA